MDASRSLIYRLLTLFKDGPELEGEYGGGSKGADAKDSRASFSFVIGPLSAGRSIREMDELSGWWLP